MRILFIKNALPLSKLICDITKEPVSHTAIEFSFGIVIHSNFKGVHLEWARNFRKKNEVVLELSPFNPDSGFPSIEPDWMESKDTLNKMLEKHEFSWYDVGGLLFLGFCFMLRSWFHIPLPKRNLWQSTGMYLCTEWVQEYIDEKNIDSMITPYKLYEKLLESKRWKRS